MNSELLDSIEENDIGETKKILGERSFTKEELTVALHAACEDSFHLDPSMIELLLEKGADPNVLFYDDFSEEHESLLHRIFWLQEDKGQDYHYRISEMFFRFGANPNITNEEGKGNAFYLACNFLWEDVVKLFLQHGALPDNPSLPDSLAATALYEVFTRGDDHDAMARITQLLLSAGARPDVACRSWQRTPLMMAVNSNAKEAVKLLLKSGANPGHRDRDGVSIAELAAKKGYRKIINLLKKDGAEVSHYQQYSSALREAFKSGDYVKAADYGDNLVKLVDLSPNDCLLISAAWSYIGRHDEAIDLAQKCNDLEESEKMISRLITAIVMASEYDRAIEAWKIYKSRVSFKSFDPFMIANLLFAYDRLERQTDGIAELKEWFEKDGAGHDKGLMKFNAACLYSLERDEKNALLMASHALEQGKERESFYNDPGLAHLREQPFFKILMSEDHNIAVALEQRETKSYAEIVLQLRDVIFRESDRRGDLESFHATTMDYKSLGEAILAYQGKLDQLSREGFRKVEAYAIEYWVEQFSEGMKRINEDQNKGDLPSLSGYVVEWDFGEDDCNRLIWTGLYGKISSGDANDFFSSYAYSDDTVGEDTFDGPPIDTALQFEEIVNKLIRTKEFGIMKKESSFFFVYQEHDAGHIHTVKV